MKHQVRCCAWKSHPPPLAHYPRIPGVFIADHVIVCIYPRNAVITPPSSTPPHTSA